MKIKDGKFVSVVAHADPSNGQGEILYVNPVSRVQEQDAQAKRSDEFELVVFDAAGQELLRLRPVLQMPASAQPGGALRALIQENIAFVEGMDSVALLYRGNEVSRFRAGHGKAQMAALGLAPDAAGSGNRLASGLNASPEPGVSYTVMVKREGEPHWQAIAVGKNRPDFELDRNQFPGAKKVRVKVLRNTGFEQDVVSEDDVDLGY